MTQTPPALRLRPAHSTACLLAGLAVAAWVAPAASGQTAVQLAAADQFGNTGDPLIPAFVDGDTGSTATLDRILSDTIAPNGNYVFTAAFAFNELVEVIPGVFQPVAQARTVLFGDIGGGPTLLFEDEDNLGGFPRQAISSPIINSAGDLAYTSFVNENIPSLVPTVTEAIWLNSTVVAAPGGAVPAAAGFSGGATFETGSVGKVALLDDGDLVFSGEGVSGGTAAVISGDPGDNGFVGDAVNQAILRYDKATGTVTSLLQTGDVITNDDGPNVIIGIAEINNPANSAEFDDFDVSPIGAFGISDDGQQVAYVYDLDPADDNTEDVLVYNGQVAEYVDGSDIVEGVTVAPDRLGGDGVSVISSFSLDSVNNKGFWASRVDLGSVAADDVIVVNGGVSVVQGTDVPISADLGGGTFSQGTFFNNVTMNNDGDLAYTTNDGIILNGEVVVLQGVTGIDGGGVLADLGIGFGLSDRDVNGDVTILLEAQAVNVSGLEELYSILITPQALVEGDFDYNRVVDDTDIDILGDYLGVDGFDLDGDADNDADDLTFLVETVLGTNFGNANLDTVVDLLDFDALAANFGAKDAGWAGGDFNGDQFTDLLDFDALASNFGAVNPAAVPEPASILLAAPALWLVGRRRRSGMACPR
ncbi:MAG: hypothetical protein AAF288_00575 [Planctomycetota bacterium]